MKPITITTTTKIVLTPEELISGFQGGVHGLIDLIKCEGYEVTAQSTASPEEKILQAVCDLHGLSYFSNKEEILEVFKTQILKT